MIQTAVKIILKQIMSQFTANNKYFKACYKSAINSSIKNYKAKIKNCERQLKKYPSGYYNEMYREELAGAKKYLAKLEEEFQKAA